MKFMVGTSQSRLFAVCISNEGFRASLELRKIYVVLPDIESERSGMIRIIDESGEDYLYPGTWFMPIEVSQELQLTLKF